MGKILVLDLNDEKSSDFKYKYYKFNDGEPHIEVENVERDSEIKVKTSICNADELFRLLLVDDVLKRKNVRYDLRITYLMGQRMDRVMGENRPFTLDVMRGILNGLSANSIEICCVHNEGAVSGRFTCLRPDALWKVVSDGKYGILIGADASSLNHFGVKCSEGFYHFVKQRDVGSGKILSIEPCEALRKFINDNPGIDCPLFFIDDLCDMGGTFLWGLEKLREIGWKPVSATLCVCHAPVVEGLARVCKVFDNVIVTDTCPHVKDLNIANLEVVEFD